MPAGAAPGGGQWAFALGWISGLLRKELASEESGRSGLLDALAMESGEDCLTAATALEHRLALVTRNVTDFEDVDGLKIVNPWND